jgi:hypothetical protein
VKKKKNQNMPNNSDHAWLVYIVCHLLHLLYLAGVVGAFVWLAHQLRCPWVVFGLIFACRPTSTTIRDR